MAQYIEFTPEQKERAATVDLEEFLLRQGEKLIKSGREKRLASDHSVTVRGCEWFDHASNEGGRAVSFVQKYYGKSYVEAMSMLLGESMEPVYPQAKKQELTQQKPFAPPVPNANMHRVFAYLLKTRGLDADVVSYFARKKMLYEDAAHHNAVFIGTDEGNCPRHAHLRSTNSFGKAFRLNVESSDPRYSFHYNGTDGSLYVFEAPIDMLSYISMNPHQWQEHSYVACCGTSPLPVMQMLKPDTQIVYLCLDNDDAGHKASERMAEQLHERGVMTERLVPELKDWNDDLFHAQKEELTSNNKLSEQLRRLKQEKARLLDTDSDDLVDRTRDLMDVLEDGPDFLDSFDAELFDALVEKVIVDSNERLRFKLKNGLELTEQIERTKR